MEKVKIFTLVAEPGGFGLLEQTVNAWLAENGMIEIISRQVFGSAFHVELMTCTIVIFYRAMEVAPGR